MGKCALTLLFAAILLTGCGGDTPRAAGTAQPLSSKAVAALDAARPVALIDGEPIAWAEVLPLLGENAGGAVVQEIVLDRRLARQMAEQRVTFPNGEAAAVAAERALFVRTLKQADKASSSGIPTTADEAERLLNAVRQNRGLGEQRFAALLRRSAMLRALVQDEVQLTEEAVQAQFAIRYGEKHRCRIIVTPTQAQAASVLAMLQPAVSSGDPVGLASAFGDQAVLQSTDPSARPSGLLPGRGMIEPFSVLDPAYPEVIRQSVKSLKIGQLSQILALNQGYAILLLESIDAAAPAILPDVRTELEIDLRTRLERIRMDALVTRLLAQPGVTIMDRSVNWSYENLARPSR